MLFTERTMNKETQLGRNEKGIEKKGNPQSCAHYLWNLTVDTESIPRKCGAAENISSLAVGFLPHLVLQKGEVPLKR